MQIVMASCPACGGRYDGRITSRFVTCEYCGSRFALSPEELEALGFVDADGDGFDDNDDAPKTVKQFEEASSEPMTEYARKACNDFLNDRSVDQDSFESTHKIRTGLGVDGHDIYLIHDDTLFKSGKNGFAITSRGFSCREMGDGKAHFISWDDLAEGAEPTLDDSYIRQGNTSLVYFTDDSDVREGPLFKLVKKLYKHACGIA